MAFSGISPFWENNEPYVISVNTNSWHVLFIVSATLLLLMHLIIHSSPLHKAVTILILKRKPEASKPENRIGQLSELDIFPPTLKAPVLSCVEGIRMS